MAVGRGAMPAPTAHRSPEDDRRIRTTVARSDRVATGLGHVCVKKDRARVFRNQSWLPINWYSRSARTPEFGQPPKWCSAMTSWVSRDSTGDPDEPNWVSQ